MAQGAGRNRLGNFLQPHRSTDPLDDLTALE